MFHERTLDQLLGYVILDQDPMDHQAPLSMGFSRQEYCSGLPCPPSGHLPNPGIEPGSPTLQAEIYHLSHQGSPRRLSILTAVIQGLVSWPRNAL